MMRITRRFTTVALAALLAALPAIAAAQALPKAASPEAVGMSAERLGRITRVMQDAARDRQTAGTVTLVLRDGQVVYFEAAGNADLEKNAPMRTDTIFRIASMTKAVVSVGVMMLVEEGRISLTDPVSKFIPAFAKTTVLASDGGRVAVVPARRPDHHPRPAHPHRRHLLRAGATRAVVHDRPASNVVLRRPDQNMSAVDRQAGHAALRVAARRTLGLRLQHRRARRTSSSA